MSYADLLEILTESISLIFTEEYPALYDELYKAEVEVKESCSNHKSLKLLINSITDRMDQQIQELCADAVLCDSVLDRYKCQTVNMSSVITVSFSITVKSRIREANYTVDTMESLQVLCTLI